MVLRSGGGGARGEVMWWLSATQVECAGRLVDVSVTCKDFVRVCNECVSECKVLVFMRMEVKR